MAVRSGPQTWHFGLEYLSRGFHNDVRYLLDGPAPASAGAPAAPPVLAMAERHVAPGGPGRQGLQVHVPLHGSFVRTRGLPRIQWELMVDGRSLGLVRERHWIMRRREIVVQLPAELGLPVQCFFLLLMLTMSYS